MSANHHHQLDTCLDENTILDFVTGRLTPSTIAVVERHLDGCERCQLLLSSAGLEEREDADAASWPRLGQRIGGRFMLREWLGCGATGVVFAARDEQLDVDVALKLLRWDPRRGSEREREAMLACLRREILVGRRISHPNVCRVYDFGSSDGYDFITMALVHGRTLAEVMRDGVELVRAVAILDSICSALEAAHDEGVIHRDLKPTNIMVDHDGVVTVMDFGLARDALAPEGSREARLVGTPAYWAPEQLRGAAASVATDLYALGLIAFELLSGQPSSRLAERNALSLVPAPYRRVLRKCLSADVEARPASAAELRRELRRAGRMQNRNVGRAALALLALATAASVFITACARPSSHALGAPAAQQAALSSRAEHAPAAPRAERDQSTRRVEARPAAPSRPAFRSAPTQQTKQPAPVAAAAFVVPVLD